MKTRLIITLAALSLVGVFAVQQHSIRTLRDEVAALRQRQTVGGPVELNESPASADGFWAPENAPVTDGDVSERLARLELAVSRWNRAADMFMDRGMLPPSAEKLAEFRQKFLDPNVSARDRLEALRLLRRNNAISPEVIQGAIAWLNTNPDPGSIRGLLQGLEGLTDPALFDPIYSLASTSTNRTVLGAALQALARFKDDPRTLEFFWTQATTSTNADLRNRARQLLGDVGINAASLATWQNRALDPAATVEQRALILRLLAGGDGDLSAVAGAFAQAAQTTTDKDEFMAWLGAFDDVNNPAFLASVVRGVQSPDAEIRRRAADALRDYRSDPAALQWLQYLAQSDPDPRVREEAARGLRDRPR